MWVKQFLSNNFVRPTMVGQMEKLNYKNCWSIFSGFDFFHRWMLLAWNILMQLLMHKFQKRYLFSKWINHATGSLNVHAITIYSNKKTTKKLERTIKSIFSVNNFGLKSFAHFYWHLLGEKEPNEIDNKDLAQLFKWQSVQPTVLL